MTFDRYDFTVSERNIKKKKKNRTNSIHWPINDTRIWEWMWATTANRWRETQSVKFKEAELQQWVTWLGSWANSLRKWNTFHVQNNFIFTFTSFEILRYQLYRGQDNEEYLKFSNVVWTKSLRVQISQVLTPKEKQEGEDQGLCFIHTQGLAGIITTYYSVTVASHSLTSARVTYISTHKHPICIIITVSACSQPHLPQSSKFNLQIHTNTQIYICESSR